MVEEMRSLARDREQIQLERQAHEQLMHDARRSADVRQVRLARLEYDTFTAETSVHRPTHGHGRDVCNPHAEHGNLPNTTQCTHSEQHDTNRHTEPR